MSKSLLNKVVKLSVTPYSRKKHDETYLKRNGLYLVEKEKFEGPYYASRHYIKLKGINGYRNTCYFQEVPEAIVRDLRIESVLKRTKKDIIITEPIGERGIDKIENKEKLLIKIILKKIYDLSFKLTTIDDLINIVIDEDINYSLKLEDFSGLKELTFTDLIQKIKEKV